MVVENQTDRMYAGNKRVFEYTVTDADASGDPPLDLSSFDVRWAMSLSDEMGEFSTIPVLQKTEGAGIQVTDAAGGVCQVTLDSSDTVSLDAEAPDGTPYHFELELVDAASAVVTVATGEIRLLPNVVNT
jgi:hypothetical protein